MTDNKGSHEFRTAGGTLYVLFAGRLGANECPGIEEDLEKHLADAPQSIVFDLQRADFVFSAFLRVCIRTGKRLEGGRLSIINASPSIKEVFTAAGFDQVPVIHVQ